MCDANNGVIYNYGEKGAGAEARVFLQFRTGFPGIGGCIETTEGAKVAFRKNHNTVHGEGDGDFLRHTLCKKLDDYFGRMKKIRANTNQIKDVLASIGNQNIWEGHLKYFEKKIKEL